MDRREAPPTDTALKKRFINLWTRLTARPTVEVEPVWGLLRRHYGEFHRHYHTLDHVAHCLGEMDRVRHCLGSEDAVELAVWFHDVICHPQWSDNEARSAQLLHSVADDVMDADLVDTVDRLILTTTYRQEPRDNDARYLSDIDLSSLGRPWERFLEDSAALRAEQPGATEADYRAAKRRFFKGVMVRPRIYYTPWFTQRYEESARDNIGRFLARMDRSPDTP